MGILKMKRKAETQLTPDTVDQPARYEEKSTEHAPDTSNQPETKEPTADDKPAQPSEQAEKKDATPGFAPGSWNFTFGNTPFNTPSETDSTSNKDANSTVSFKDVTQQKESFLSFSVPGSGEKSSFSFNFPTSTPSAVGNFSDLSSKTKEREGPEVREIEIHTGEEDENKVFSQNVKLYQLTEVTKKAEEKTENTKDGEAKSDDKEQATKPDGAASASTTEEKSEPKDGETKSDEKPEEKTEEKTEEKPTEPKSDTKADDSKKAAQSWKERGKGELRLNQNKEQKERSRIIVRTDKTHQLIVNMPLYKTMWHDRPTDTAIRFRGPNCLASTTIDTFLVRLRTKEDTDAMWNNLQTLIGQTQELQIKSDS